MAKNTVLNFIGLVLPLIIGVITIPYIIRKLGTERFGILSLAWVVVGYFSFFDLGLGRATTKFVAEALGKGETEKIPIYFWTTVIFQGVLGLIGMIILALTTPLLVGGILHVPSNYIGETKATFLMISISLPIVLVSASFRGILEAGQRFDIVNLVKIPSSIVNYILPVVGILLGSGLPGIMVLLVVSRGCSLLVWIWFTLKIYPVLKTRLAFYREAIRPLLSFGGWVTVSNSVGPILIYIDRVLISSLITLEAVGFYSAPYEFVMRLGVIPASLLMTLFPTFSALAGQSDREKIRALFGRSIKFLLLTIGTIVVVLILISKYFLGIWLGEKFLQNSLLVFQILAFGFLANSLANIPYGFLQGIGRVDLPAKFHLGETLFYVPLTWVLIKKWGINGAALSWTIRVFVDMLLLFWGSVKFGRIKLSGLFPSGVIKAVVTLFLFSVLGILLKKSALGLYGIFALSVCYIAIIWIYLIDKSEKAWLLNVMNAAKRRLSV